MNEDKGIDELRELESRLQDAVLGGPAPLADAASDRVLNRVRSHVRTNPHGRGRGWSSRFFIFAAIAVPAAAAAALALAIISGQPQKALVPAPAASPRAVPSALPTSSPSAATPTPVLVEISRPPNLVGPQTVHWVSTNGTELASRPLPNNEAILGAGGSHVLIYRTDGHVLDLHLDGTTDDVGSGMPTQTAPGPASVPFRFLVSPDGTQWVWSEIVTQSGNSVTSKIAVAGIRTSARTVAQSVEDNRALEPYRWTLANPLISHGAMGVGGYILFGPPYGQVYELDLATGKQTPIGPADASAVDLSGNGAKAYIEVNPGTTTQGLIVNGPGARGLSANLPSAGQAGGVMFDSSSNHVVFATSPASGPPHERFETDVIDLNSGARTKLGPADLRPAGWLADGRLIEFRTSSDGDGSPGTYLVSLDGSATQVSSYDTFIGIAQVITP